MQEAVVQPQLDECGIMSKQPHQLLELALNICNHTFAEDTELNWGGTSDLLCSVTT